MSTAYSVLGSMFGNLLAMPGRRFLGMPLVEPLQFDADDVASLRRRHGAYRYRAPLRPRGSLSDRGRRYVIKGVRP